MSYPTAECSRMVELLLELSVLRYSIDPKTSQWSDPGGPYPHDSPERWSKAAMLLVHNPSIAQESIHTAVVAQDVERVRTFLQEDPSLVSAPHDFDGWQPLMRLAYTRLPGHLSSSVTGSLKEVEGLGEINPTPPPSLVIAKLLLEAGADPSGGSLEGDAKAFTALTGVIGGGEHNQPPHPQAEDLARLLFEYGADPLDGQALYNTSLVHGQESPAADTRTGNNNDEVSWLEFIWGEEIQRRIKYDNFGLRVTRDNDYDEEARSNAEAQVCARWRELLPNGALPAPPFVYLLHSAVMHHQPRRVKWLIEHGADADASIIVDGDKESGSGIRCIELVEAAEAKGYGDIAELLSWYRDPRLRIAGSRYGRDPQST